MQNIDNFGKSNDSLKPNYYQQNAQNQAYYNNYQKKRSDFIVTNQFAHHGCPDNNKFTGPHNYHPLGQQQPKLYQHQQSQYQHQQSQYQQQQSQYQQQQLHQGYYNNQSLNSNLILLIC